ncbi:MAG: high-potential iron-sulfur protein [Pseudomonadota bacterium]
MSNNDRKLINRRHFVASAVAAAAFARASTASSEELPELEETDPTAVALKYVHDATTVGSSLRSEDRYCYNCALYAGTAEEEWAACSIFPGKRVAGKGWCSVWAPRQ